MHSIERVKSMESSYSYDSRRDSFATRDSFDSQSSRPTTIESESPNHSYVRMSPKPTVKVITQGPQMRGGHYPSSYQDDLSPNTATCARSSVETYASTNPSLEDFLDADEEDMYSSNIPPLPLYRHDVVEPDVQPASPHEFSKLFPSMDRLSIRHDEFTSDGNMNLRVDTTVQSTSRHRRPRAVQLFHLRMHDLERRDFSLRRYCRDSGREVCSSKRKYCAASSPSSIFKSSTSFPCSPSSPFSPQASNDKSRPTLTRSVTSAITRSFSSARPESKSKSKSKFSQLGKLNTSVSFHSMSDGSSNLGDDCSDFDGKSPRASSAAAATNVMKLDFSNYARIDIERKGKDSSKHYDFEWWGQKYSWRRATDKDTGIVSFHLVRQGQGAGVKVSSNKGGIQGAVAHIVPEARSQVQIAADEEAGGWIPPCHFWIDDWNVLNAKTDVADVIMATGLMALVDDCIKRRWRTPKIHRIPMPLSSRTWNVESPKVLLQRAFAFKAQNSTPKTGDATTRPVAVYEDDEDDDDEYYGPHSYRANRHRHPLSAY